MKCADPGIVERQPFADQKIANAILHLLGGFVGERHGQDGAAVNTLLDQIGDAIRDGARLARSGAGQNQYGALNGGGGFALSGVEFV
jgi:hypothetical protein